MERATVIEFIVPAVPVAQPRPRATAVGGHARVYAAPQIHAVHAFKATCRLAARSAYAGPPLEGPLRLTIDCVLPRPKSTPKKFAGRRWRTSRPDVENLAKSLQDAVNGLLWLDDSQVVSLAVAKYVAAIDEQPHVLVTVEQLSSEPPNIAEKGPSVDSNSVVNEGRETGGE